MQGHAETADTTLLEYGADGDIVDRDGIAPHHRNRPPWPDGMDIGAPARHMTEQRRAEILQARRRDHLRPPARTGPRLRQAGTERPEAQSQFIAARKRHRNLMRREHALGKQDFLAVQEDMAERR